MNKIQKDRALEAQKSTWHKNFDLLRSDDPERSSELVSTVLSKVQYLPLKGERAFSHAVKIVRIGEFNIWKTSSASGFELQSEDAQNIRFEIHFVETGHYYSRTDHQDFDAHYGQAYILQHFNKHNILCQPMTEQICISIPQARYAKLIATEFEVPEAPLSAFRPVVDIVSTEMQNLRQLAELLLSLGCSARNSWQTSIGAHLLKEAFLALFIEGWPQNGAHRSVHAAKPFYVKRALDWIHEHAGEKVLLDDLSSVSGVSIRTLQLGFRKFVGLSPMGYLLKVRLQHAHNDLLSDPSITIDEISTRWGFPSPSKFAAQIRSQYGNNPSDLRKLFHVRRHQKQ